MAAAEEPGTVTSDANLTSAALGDRDTSPR